MEYDYKEYHRGVTAANQPVHRSDWFYSSESFKAGVRAAQERDMYEKGLCGWRPNPKEAAS